MNPFRLKRKAKLYKDRKKYTPIRSIVSVESLGKKETQCIRVNASDSLYITDDCIVTHNTAIYFVDEAAYLERPELVEASLSQTTNCRIDISSANGTTNPFYVKRFGGKLETFTFFWRDDPRKDDVWYEKQKKELSAVVVAQEIDIDYTASVEGIIIPQAWVLSAVDAHLKIKGMDSGGWMGALDVADEGDDSSALSFRKGVVLNHAEDWRKGDTGETTRKAVADCIGRTPVEIQYDCIGVGAGVKAEVNRLSGDMKLPRGISFVPWNAGAAVVNPEERVIKRDSLSPLNKEFYANLKAQGWWSLRARFEKTHRMLTEKGVKYDADELISLDSHIPRIEQLKQELSQPTIGYTGASKIIVDKKPDGSKSPNLADSVMMNYFPLKSLAVWGRLT